MVPVGTRDQKIDRAVLQFTVKRGRNVGVSKEDYFWEISKLLNGMTYGELWRSLQRLKERGYVTIELLEKMQWMVHPTENGVHSLDAPKPRRTTMFEAAPPAPQVCPKCLGELPRSARVCTNCGLSLAWTKL